MSDSETITLPLPDEAFACIDMIAEQVDRTREETVDLLLKLGMLSYLESDERQLSRSLAIVLELLAD